MLTHHCHTPARLQALGALLFTLLCSACPAASALTVRFVTFNVNFNNSYAKIKADVQTVAPNGDIIMFQEAKGVTIDDFLDASWTVVQVVNQGDAKRGSAIAIRNSIMTQKIAQGLRFGVDSNGEQMLDRYIAWADVKLTNGQILRVMSLHMPPARYAYLQPIMADNLVTFMGETSYHVVVGADWNYTVTNDPYDIEGRTGLIPRGSGIDGFYRDNSVVKFTSLTKMTGLAINSDHDPVQMITSVQPPPDSAVADWNLY